MKTKVLLSTMVLAAALAGCSQDEWGVNNSNTSNLDNRRSVGNVVLSLTDPSTRMEETEDGSIVYSADDKVGAHLMDEFAGTYPIGNLVNYAQSNHPFQQDGDDWKTTGVLLEGNYFFTYPFNACQQNRNAVINTVPVDQYAYDRETGEFNPKQSYIDNQFYVGYKYLHADNDCVDCNEVGSLTAHVEMEKVHAYPIFKFSMEVGNPSDKPLKIYKVSLRNGSELSGYEMFYNTVAVFPQAKEFKADPNADNTNSEGKYDLWKTAVYNRNMPGQPHSANPFDAKEVCSSKTLEYNLLFPEGGMEVNNWDEFEVWMTVPAGVYKDLQLLLYTDKGVGIYDIDKPNDNKDSEVQNGTRTLTPKRQTILVRVQSGSLSMNEWGFTVQTTENLIEYLKYVAQVGDEEVAKVTTVGDEVELNQEVYEILKNANLKLNLNGTLVIPAGVPADAIDRIDYYNNNAKLINEGVQVIDETPVGKFGFTEANVRIDNKGELTLNADMPLSVINNFGKLTVNKSSVYGLINLPEATATVTKELNVINLLNMGELTVNASAEVNILSKWFNIGTTNNNGKITTWPLDFKNPTFMTLIDYTRLPAEYINWWKGWAVKVEINKIYQAFIAASAEAVNYGVINNNVGATIDSKGGIIRDEQGWTYVMETIIPTHFGAYIIEGDYKGWVPTTSELVAVTSLVNLGSRSVIDNYGTITNLSNFGMLIAEPKQDGATAASVTWLVDMEADCLGELSETQEAAELYLQGPLGFVGVGFIDMSENDGVKVSDQAILNDNENKVLESDQQIIFVKRTGSTDFFVDLTENKTNQHKSAPKYINTIWFENATATITGVTGENGDISEKTFWMTGKNTINVEKEKTLKLGPVYMDGENTLAGAGTVELNGDIFVNSGKFNSVVKLDAKTNVKVFGNVLEYNEINLGNTWNKENIEISEISFSNYVGPWIVIER